jgi:hypothetical protein
MRTSFFVGHRRLRACMVQSHRMELTMRRTMLLLSGVALAVCVGRTLVAQTLPVPRGARVRVVTTASKTPVIGNADAVTDTMG